MRRRRRREREGGRERETSHDSAPHLSRDLSL
jgi:hypothetical protein